MATSTWWWYSSPDTPSADPWVEDIGSAIRLGSITGLSGEAEMGAVGTGNVVLDDPVGTVGHNNDGIVGLKQFFVNELACPVGNQRLYTAYVADRRYHRGQTDSLITGVARKIDVTLTDLNSFLSFRVFAPTEDDPTSDFVRPAETDLERVQAMLTTVDFLSTTLFDVGYIPSTGGVAMDAHDYTGKRPIDVLNDCAQVSGRNFWVKYHEETNQLALWYDIWTTDGSATLAYDSDLRLTNVLAEVDGTTTFAITPDAVGVLDPSRLVSAAYGEGTGVTSYETRPATADTFAWRDMTPQSFFVTSQPKLDALLARYLTDNSTEDYRISCTVQLPLSLVTGIHEGMRLQVHFTHLPQVQDTFTWTRVLQRTIRQDVETPQYYWLDLELSPLPPTEVYWLSFIAQRAGSATGAGFAPAGHAVSCVDDDPINDWTHLSDGFVQGGGDYPIDSAYRDGAGDQVPIQAWGSLNGTSRPTGYHLQLSGTTGVPVDVDVLNNQAPTTSLVGPTVVSPGDGWMFAFFSGRRAGDGGTVYTLASPGDATELGQAFGGGNPDPDGFSPRSWLGYVPVTTSESVTFELVATFSVEYACMMVFVPGDLSIAEYQMTGSGGSMLCWTWAT